MADDEVRFSSLGKPLFDGAGVTKGELVEYLSAVADRFVPVLAGRPLSVVRVREGQDPFMQKNLSQYAPDWIRTITLPTQAARREVRYPLCDDRRTLMWLANQRAVEYHPTLFRGDGWNSPTHLVIDLDPPEGGPFSAVTATAHLVRQVLDDAGTAAAVETSGSKGVHVFVPLDGSAGAEDVAAATRAIAARAARLDPSVATVAFVREDREGKVFVDSTRSGGASVVAAYSPRARPGVPVSFPLAWDALDGVAPADFTIRTAPGLLAGGDPWRDLMPPPQPLDPGLVEEGRTIPIARVQAMHEGKRRKRAAAARDAEG